ncbi:MAG: hypothetical protein AAFV62_08340, partial [Pseudomonadota bacterium]
ASAATAAFEPADFVQISAGFDTMAPAGNDQFVEIANLIGVAGTQTFIPDPGGSGLASFGPTSPTFQTISLPVTEILNAAGITSTSFTGDLTFVVSISTQNEFFAFDNVETSEQPPEPIGSMTEERFPPVCVMFRSAALPESKSSITTACDAPAPRAINKNDETAHPESRTPITAVSVHTNSCNGSTDRTTKEGVATQQST